MQHPHDKDDPSQTADNNGDTSKDFLHFKKSSSKERDGNNTPVAVHFLDLIIKLMIQTSSQVLKTKTLNNIRESTQKYLQNATPIRYRELLQLLNTVLINARRIATLAQEKPSHEDRQTTVELAEKLASNSVQFLTSPNIRQCIIESMGVFIKAIEALHTPETKVFLSSLPVLYIRILDTLSSGGSKNLIHLITDFIWSVIGLMSRTETTQAFAEVTAHLVNTMERDNYRQRIKRRSRPFSTSSKRGRVRVAMLSSALRRKGHIQQRGRENAKRRYDRNRYIEQTYTNRIILDDDNHGSDTREGTFRDRADMMVADAILSSLGDGSHLNQEAWLTQLGGRQGYDMENDSKEEEEEEEAGYDESSLPSNIVCSNSTLLNDKNEASDEYDHREGDIDGNDQVNINTSTLTHLRSGIENRAEKVIKGQRKILHHHENKQSHEMLHGNESNEERPKSSNVDASGILDANDIEDLVIDDFSIDEKGADLTVCDMDGESMKEIEQSREPIAPKKLTLQQNTENLSSNTRAVAYIATPPLPISTETMMTKTPLKMRGSESSIAQFYHILDELQTKIKNETTNNDIFVNNECHGVMIQGSQEERNDNGETKKRGNMIRLKRKFKHRDKSYIKPLATVSLENKNNQHMQNEFTTSDVGGSTGEDSNQALLENSFGLANQVISFLTLRQKIIGLMMILCFVLFHAIWFGFGIYGVYSLLYYSPESAMIKVTNDKLLRYPPNPDLTQETPILQTSGLPTVQREIVIKVVHELTHTNLGGKHIGNFQRENNKYEVIEDHLLDIIEEKLADIVL